MMDGCNNRSCAASNEIIEDDVIIVENLQKEEKVVDHKKVKDEVFLKGEVKMDDCSIDFEIYDKE